MYLTLDNPPASPASLGPQSAFTRFVSSGSGYNTGLGACGCGGACCGGLGYFDSGWDISGWGWMEWGTVLGLAYVLISTFSTTKRGYGKVRRSYRVVKGRARQRRREQLERELEGL